MPLAGCTALQALRDVGHATTEQRVLINGASGGVGTFAVQLARALGAAVTAVRGTRNVDLVRSLGADHVIDYTREDITDGGHRYDVILDIAGTHALAGFRRVLAPGGTLVPVGGTGGRWLGPAPRLSWFNARLRLRPFVGRVTAEDLLVLTRLIEAGKVTPAIDRAYRLSATAEALGYVAAGHASAKVVITV